MICAAKNKSAQYMSTERMPGFHGRPFSHAHPPTNRNSAVQNKTRTKWGTVATMEES